MMSCYEATCLMSESQDRKLSLKERMALGIHTAMCTACRRFDHHLMILRLAMKRYAGGVERDK